MPRKANLSITDSGHAKQPDFSIPAAGAKHHDAVAKHFDEAARRQRQAAKLYPSGHPEKARHHAQLGYAHHLHAEQHAEETAKADLQNYYASSR